MKSPLSSRRRCTAGSLEPLEARIAPARIIVVGLPDNPASSTHSDTDYSDTVGQKTRPDGLVGPFFINTSTSTDAISEAVGGASVTDGSGTHYETYYLSLQAGDTLRVFTPTGQSTDVITVNSGKVVAFFEDKDFLDTNGSTANEVHVGDLVSLSVTKNANFTLRTSLDGSIVTDLNPDGKSLDLNDLVSPSQGIKSITEQGGDIAGNILSGGTIASLSLRNVTGIYAGTGAIGQSYSFFPTLSASATANTTMAETITALGPAVGTTPALTLPHVGQAGASITNVNLDSVGTIQAGGGGLGAVGGSIVHLIIRSDTDGINLIAGTGGDADSTQHVPNAGAGGSISTVYMAGVVDTTANSLISAQAGNGGIATTGVGGHGGAVTQFNVGKQLVGGTLFTSNDLLADDVLLQSGNGGDGKIGGSGGNLNVVRLTTNTDFDAGLGAKGLLAELSLLAGHGGDSTITGIHANAALHAGAGGSVLNATVLNQAQQVQLDINPTGQDASILVKAGNAGTVTGSATDTTPTVIASGAAGGSLTGIKLLGSNMTADAGNGSDGLIGGAGGALTGVRVLQNSGIFAHVANFNAGAGGNGSTGHAGNGGAIINLTSDGADFTALDINALIGAAAGGNSLLGRGGNGGALNTLTLFDENSLILRNDLAPYFGQAVIESGTGGNGKLGGGHGGSLLSTEIESVDVSYTITTGQGGQGLINSSGGAGGVVHALQVSATGSDSDSAHDRGGTTVSTNATLNPVSLFLTTGNGGGGTRAGGAGGNIAFAEINVDGTGSVIGGNGGSGGDGGMSGSGPKGAAGAGASIVSSGVFAVNGSGSMIAGNAGAIGSAPGHGGNIQGLSAVALSGLYAATDLTIQAGNGGVGGAGGAIVNMGYGSATQNLEPVPTGNIIVKAGDGSAYQRTATSQAFAGAGGSIIDLSGSVSRGLGTITSITAGDGGGASNVSKSGAGGSITTVRLQRGPTDADSFAQSTVAGSDFPLSVLTITAGDAGDAKLFATDSSFVNTVVHGANGGSVTSVVALDIGTATVFRSLSAGDAGPGIKVGGIGGSVTRVRVAAHDIGVRSGEVYGYGTMGGIFVGLGGAGGVGAAVGATGKAGRAGNVQNISADSISAIAAGKSDAPQLANTVSNITLNDITALQPLRATDNTSEFYLMQDGNSTEGDLLGSGLPGIPQDGNLPGNATPAQVQAALAAVGINATVTAPVNAQYQIAFSATGSQDPITVNRLVNDLTVRTVPGTATVDETQEVQPLGVGTFTLSFEGFSTNPIPAGASPMAVQTELNTDLTAVIPEGVHVTAGPHGSYDVQFQETGLQGAFIQSTETATSSSSTMVAGNGVTKAVQLINFPLLRGVNPLILNVAGDTGPLTVMPTNTPANSMTGAPAASQPVTAAQVQMALNSDPAILAAGEQVTVSLTANNTFNIVFSNPANAVGITITGSDQLPATATEISQGFTKSTTSSEVTPGDGTSTMEVQDIKLDSGTQQFTLSYTGANTTQPFNVLPASATPAQMTQQAEGIQTALNNLPDAPTNVVVTPDGTGGYNVTYQDVNPHPEIMIGETAQEQQVVSLSTLNSATNPTHFTLAVDGMTTGPLDLHATATQVQTALVAAGVTGAMVTGGADGNYTISYADSMMHDLPTVTETSPLTASGPVVNMVNTGVDHLGYVRQVTFDPSVYAGSHIVGAITGFNRLGSDNFQYLNALGNPIDTPFALGDVAVDGLIAAKNFSQKTSNFTPEARLIVNSDVSSSAAGIYKPVDPTQPGVPVFYDFNDQI